uniref:Uncharacterized protein n=1 Tax=Panagrolaimus davidi TaxID=227884 RepID=A0A914P1G3_9BILA
MSKNSIIVEDENIPNVKYIRAKLDFITSFNSRKKAIEKDVNAIYDEIETLKSEFSTQPLPLKSAESGLLRAEAILSQTYQLKNKFQKSNKWLQTQILANNEVKNLFKELDVILLYSIMTAEDFVDNLKKYIISKKELIIKQNELMNNMNEIFEGAVAIHNSTFENPKYKILAIAEFRKQLESFEEKILNFKSHSHNSNSYISKMETRKVVLLLREHLNNIIELINKEEKDAEDKIALNKILTYLNGELSNFRNDIDKIESISNGPATTAEHLERFAKQANIVSKEFTKLWHQINTKNQEVSELSNKNSEATKIEFVNPIVVIQSVEESETDNDPNDAFKFEMIVDIDFLLSPPSEQKQHRKEFTNISFIFLIDGKFGIEINQNGTKKMLKNMFDNDRTPLYLSMAEKSIEIGETAKSHFRDFPNYVVYDILKIIGKSINEIKIDPKWGFEIIENNGILLFQIETQNGKRMIPEEMILAAFFKTMKFRTETYLNENIKEIYLSTNFKVSESQRIIFKKAALKVNLEIKLFNFIDYQ